MGKDRKKDPEKRFALQAQKAAKADRKAAKRLQKENRREADSTQINDAIEPTSTANNTLHQKDDDIDSLIEAYKKQTLDLTSVVVEVLDDPGRPFPLPPRGNASFTSIPTTGEFILFGGEYFNGIENVVFDELYRWDPDARCQTIHGKSQSGSDEEMKTFKHSSSEKKVFHHAAVGVWKRILSPAPRPTPRCSHSSVYYNGCLYVFGGEYATVDNYHHYRDLWKFDLKTNLWTELKPPRGGPSARSGHRVLVWRHYMILFGGFFEALKETRWYNDLYAYDFSTNSWQEFTFSKFGSIPPERSAFNFGLCPGNTDIAYVYGGFSKLKTVNPGTTAETLVHTDCWALHLKGIENGRPPVWERINRKGEYPSQRSGTGYATFKNQLLVYGGVQDQECENHRVRSVFYDDLFSFDMEKKRWFTLRLKKVNCMGHRRRRRRKEACEETDDDNVEASSKISTGTIVTSTELLVNSSDDDMEVPDMEATSSGWDIDKLRHNMFAFIDGNGNMVFEKMKSDEDEGESALDPAVVSQANTTSKRYLGVKSETETLTSKHLAPKKSLKESITSHNDRRPFPSLDKAEFMVLNADGLPEVVSRRSPLPRINAHIAMRGHTLFLYGGILEVDDREVTLDDCWSFDVQRREAWQCIWNGTMHKQVWKGIVSDSESYLSNDRDACVHGSEDNDDDNNLDHYNTIIVEEVEASDSSVLAKAERKARRKAEKKEKRREIRNEIVSLRDKLGLYDAESIPYAAEDLATFYARTTDYWETLVGTKFVKDSDQYPNGSSGTRDDSKQERFLLAQAIFDELNPIIMNLHELERIQNENDEERKIRKAAKKEKKDKK